jgi:hypothetical protein
MDQPFKISLDQFMGKSNKPKPPVITGGAPFQINIDKF